MYWGDFARDIRIQEQLAFQAPLFMTYRRRTNKISPRALPCGKVKTISICIDCLKTRVVNPFTCAKCRGTFINIKED